MSRVALVVGVLAWGVLTACAASKDGFNLYKDLLRGKIDADEPPEENENSPKLVYFFRTPVSKENEGQAGSPYAPGPEDYLGEAWSKRGSGSVLTWVLSSKQLGVRPDLRNLVTLLGMGGLVPGQRAAGRAAFVATMGKKSDGPE